MRILITGLTIGSTVFKEGDIVNPSGMRDLENLADGRLLAGRRFAEWVKPEEPDAEAKPLTPQMEAPKDPAPEAPEVFVTQPDLEPEPEPEPMAQEAPPEPEPASAPIEDFDAAIIEMVKAGKAKGAIVKELAKPANVSQRAISDKFDEMLAVGIIVAGETPGSYSVEG